MNYCLNFHILCGGLTIVDRSWSRALGEQDRCYYLYRVKNGCASMSDSANEYSLKEGSVYLIDGTRLDSILCGDMMEQDWIHILPESAALDFNLKNLAPVYEISKSLYSHYGWDSIKSITNNPSNDELKNLNGVNYLKLYRPLQNPSLEQLCAVQVLILEIARDALRSKDLHRENSLPGKIKTLQHVFSFMGSVFKNPPPVSDIARNAGMSTEHFIRTFKAETGLTPADYMKQKRMELASQLLLKTDLSIKELAFECGYRDPVYFSKVFKSYYRQSPTDYRNSFC